MRLISVSRQRMGTQAACTEMPRRRSTSRRSVWAVPSSTLPTVRMAPQCRSICSVRVVLPVSTWAITAILRIMETSIRKRGGSPRYQGPLPAPLSRLERAFASLVQVAPVRTRWSAFLPSSRRGGGSCAFFRRGTAWACPCPPLRPRLPRTCPRPPGKAARTWCPA